MIGVFKERNTFQVIILVLMAAVVKLVYLYHPPIMVYIPGRGVLSDWLNEWYKTANPFLLAFLAFIINIASALYANVVLNDQRMFAKTNMLTAMGMVLLTSLIPITNSLSSAVILLPFLIWLYVQVSDLYRIKSPRASVFDIGLAVGVGTILYHPFVFILAFGMYGLATMRTFKIKEWLILLLGFLTPYYFWFSYDFLMGYWHPQSHLPKLFYSFAQFVKDTYSVIAYGMIAIWLLLGFFYWNKSLRRMLLHARKSWNTLLLLFLLIVLMLFCHVGNAADSFALLVFPIGCFGAFAFAGPKKNVIPSVLFWLIAFVVLLFCLHFYNPSIFNVK